MSNEIIEIRWHGRGGQGAITAAKIVAEAAFMAGYGGAIMAPTFGTERRGAPVHTSLKIAREKITDLSPIKSPDIVVVLDHMIMSEVDVTAGLKPNGLVVINTNKNPSRLGLNGFRVATVDVATIAEAAGLRRGVVNTGIIGAFGRASELVDIDLLATCIEKEFSTRKPKENAQAARDCHQQTQLTS
ncbi:MAG: ketoisovalerate oxidoreductase [Gammaproteobacteria bacterium]|nr:ketoisovalerate oxidoreductase [Gammaproteobacteria bacterium]